MWKQTCQILCSAFILVGSSVALAGSPLELARGTTPKGPQQPQLAVEENGVIHVVYGVGDEVVHGRSADGGMSFSRVAELSFGRVMSLGMRRGPRIAVAQGSICITAIGGLAGKGRDGDVLAMRSNDGGKSWTGPVQVNDEANSAREGLHAMAAGPKGEMCCAWLDLRHGKTDIVASTSRDSGKTWDTNVLVYRSPEGSVCECCHPSVAIDYEGRILVQWRNSLDGNRDMYVASSVDGGRSFGPAHKLGNGTWPLDDCPMDGGGIATLNDQVFSAWRRDKSVYLSRVSGNEELLVGSGQQPWIAATQEGPIVVWISKRVGELMLLAPGQHSPTALDSGAFEPVVAARPDGSGPVVASWQSQEGDDSVIRCQIIRE
jgi:hypothetical protein